MDHSLGVQSPRTTRAPKDLSCWLTEKEFSPKSKMYIAPELVSTVDSEGFPYVLLIRPGKSAFRKVAANYWRWIPVSQPNCGQ